MSFYKEDGIFFERKQRTSARRILDAYQSLRPPDKCIKLPLSKYHLQQTFIQCIDVNECTILLPGCAMLIGHSLP